jgi:hypothetical protein
VDEWVLPYLDSCFDFFLEMNGYLLGLGPKKEKINLPNFISLEMPMTRKNLEIARNI